MSVLSDDEQRAALWRLQQQRRLLYQQQIAAQLAGSALAMNDLRRDWRPLELYLLERSEPPLPPSEDPYFDPLGLSDQVNVGL